MKTIKIDKKKLFPTLYRLSKVTRGKQIDDTLKSFHIEVNDSLMEITGSNSEVSIKEELEVISNFEDRVEFLVDAEKLTTFIEKVDGQVAMKVDSNISKLKVEHSGGSFTLPVSKGYMYRKFGYPGDNCDSVIINGEVFFSMLKNIKDAVDADDNALRPVLRNVYIDIKKDKTCIVSSDGFEMRYAEYGKGSDIEISTLISSSFIEVLMPYLKQNESVKVKIGDNRIFVMMDGVIINCILPEGKYGNYERIISTCSAEGSTCSFDIDAKTFVKHIERIECASNGLINISIGEKGCTASSDMEIDTIHVEENLNVHEKKGEMNNNFSIKKLRSVAKLLSGIHKFRKHGEMKCLWVEDEDEDVYFKYILMSFQTV